jgi:hypothetical protein
MTTTLCIGSQSFETLVRHIHEADNYAKITKTIPHACLSLDKAQCQVDNKATRLQFKQGKLQAEVDRGAELFSFVSFLDLMHPPFRERRIQTRHNAEAAQVYNRFGWPIFISSSSRPSTIHHKQVVFYEFRRPEKNGGLVFR